MFPTYEPFFTHWYIGWLPLLVDVAVNVTCCPGQIAVALAVILIDGITLPCTVIVTGADVTVWGMAQEMDDVMATVIASLF